MKYDGPLMNYSRYYFYFHYVHKLSSNKCRHVHLSGNTHSKPTSPIQRKKQISFEPNVGNLERSQNALFKDFQKGNLCYSEWFLEPNTDVLLSRTSGSVIEDVRWSMRTKKDSLIAEEVKCCHGAPHTFVLYFLHHSEWYPWPNFS